MSELERYHNREVPLGLIDLNKVARIDDLLRRGWIENDFHLLQDLPIIYVQFLKLIVTKALLYPDDHPDEKIYSTIHTYDLEHIEEIEINNPDLKMRVFYKKLCK